jgi:hypothetical protein
MSEEGAGGKKKRTCIAEHLALVGRFFYVGLGEFLFDSRSAKFLDFLRYR